MKNFFITALMLGWAVAGSAQLLSVSGVEQVKLPAGTEAAQAVISPDGKSVVMSALTSSALNRVDLTSGKVTTVTTNGSVYNLQFTDDSRNIVYRQTTTDSRHLRYTSVISADLTTGKSKTVVKPTRNLNGVAVDGRNVMTVNNKKLSVTNLDGAKAVKAPVASIYYGQLMVTANGKTTAINPNGKAGCSYLWPSVSPDGTKVVYYLSGDGCYVCNLNGSNAKRLGEIRAPRWYGNDMVIGMRDADNGVQVTSSSIVAANMSGTEQTLTSSDVIAMYPTASANGEKIAFSTPAGGLYIININR